MRHRGQCLPLSAGMRRVFNKQSPGRAPPCASHALTWPRSRALTWPRSRALFSVEEAESRKRRLSQPAERVLQTQVLPSVTVKGEKKAAQRQLSRGSPFPPARETQGWGAGRCGRRGPPWRDPTPAFPSSEPGQWQLAPGSNPIPIPLISEPSLYPCAVLTPGDRGRRKRGQPGSCLHGARIAMRQGGERSPVLSLPPLGKLEGAARRREGQDTSFGAAQPGLPPATPLRTT